MLEILGIMALCNVNKKNALKRGRKPGGYVALTIILWLGLEFLGAFVAGQAGMEIFGVYGIAILGALMGGLLSWLIAKFGSQGDYYPVSAASTVCVQCGQPLEPGAKFCTKCGATAPVQSTSTQSVPLNMCPRCGQPLEPGAKFCTKCGAMLLSPAAVPQQNKNIKMTRACSKCGEVLSEDAKFCTKCGEPSDTAVYKQYNAETKPIRVFLFAMIIFVIWLIDVILHATGILPRLVVVSSSGVYIAAAAILGFGGWMMAQRGAVNKLLGALLIVLFAVMIPFNVVMVQASYMMANGYQAVFFVGFERNMGVSLIASVLVAVAALTTAKASRGGVLTALMSAVGLILYYVIRMIIFRTGNIPVTLIGAFIDGAAVALAVLISNGISKKHRGSLKLTGWAYVWCALCLLGMIGAFIILLSTKETTLMPYIAVVAAFAGYIILISGRHIGFFVTLTAVSFIILGNLDTSLCALTYGASSYITMFISSLFGTLNPTITWLSVKKYWNRAS